MSTKHVEYFYHRQACAICRAARRYVFGYGADVRHWVDADAQPVDADGAFALARRARVVLAARNGQLIRFDMTGVSTEKPGGRAPTRRQLLEAILAPSGNLRAPTLLANGYLVVGFYEQALATALTSPAAGTARVARLPRG
jgi:hypothetical protein